MEKVKNANSSKNMPRYIYPEATPPPLKSLGLIKADRPTITKPPNKKNIPKI
jgi:hypothetical protein